MYPARLLVHIEAGTVIRTFFKRIRVDRATVEGIAEQARITPVFLVLMATSGVLAAVAFLANSIPLLVGSMVVAPALPPLALVAFAVVTGRFSYAARGFVCSLVGISFATAFAIATAWLLIAAGVFPSETVLTDMPLLEERVKPGWYSVVAALAAGVAGTIALSQNKYDTLVGVVASLAIVPAAAAAGIALISHEPELSLGGLILLGINAGLIIVTGIITLVIFRPDKTT